MRGLIITRKELKNWVSSLTCPAAEPIIAAKPAIQVLPPMNSASPSRNAITAMLRAWSDGEQHASDDLIRAVYDQLRRQARRQLRRERPDHTLDTAALINETYLKLVEQKSVRWQDRNHFFALAAELMRRVLVDHARARFRQKRGGQNDTIPLEQVAPSVHIGAFNVDLIALDEALQRLARFDERQVKVVELRYFAGLEIEETAAVLGTSPATVKRDWAAAKAWLMLELSGERAK